MILYFYITLIHIYSKTAVHEVRIHTIDPGAGVLFAIANVSG
jgi:hypothetical protein